MSVNSSSLKPVRCCIIGVIVLTALVSAMAEESALVAWWPLDKVSTEATEDVIRRTQDRLGGGFSVVPGVKGQAIRFDGFRTFIRREADRAPVLSGGFTIEGWVALGAYPWSWAPVIDHRSAQVRGFTFGVDRRGCLGIKLAGAGQELAWHTYVSGQQLPLRK